MAKKKRKPQPVPERPVQPPETVHLMELEGWPVSACGRDMSEKKRLPRQVWVRRDAGDHWLAKLNCVRCLETIHG